MAEFFWFSDEQWSRIEPLLPTGLRGARRVDDRRVLSGMVHALQSGGRWGNRLPVYGPKKTLYNRFVRWAERGVWQDIFSALAGAEGIPDRLFIDSTCIKVHRTAGGAKGGLGQWYRPDTRRQEIQGPRHLRREWPPLRADDNPRQCPRYEGRQGLHRGDAAICRTGR